jgi:hypothetical protein
MEEVACLFFAQKAERNLIKRLKSSLKFGLQMPLQAADMLAWWCRRWENELGSDPINRTRKFPWKA